MFFVIMTDCIVTHESQNQAYKGQGNKHPFVVRHIKSSRLKNNRLPVQSQSHHLMDGIESELDKTSHKGADHKSF